MAEAASTIQIDAKIQKYRPESSAVLKLYDDKIIMAGSADHHISSDSIFGNFISGKTSILADVAQIRVSGMWTLNPVLLSCIPSTQTTPNATLRLDIPSKNAKILSDITKTIKAFLT
jgi:hypothetical protein